jgi:hypothetical protein
MNFHWNIKGGDKEFGDLTVNITVPIAGGSVSSPLNAKGTINQVPSSMSAALADVTAGTPPSPVAVTVDGTTTPPSWSGASTALTSGHQYMLNVLATVGTTTTGAAVGFRGA